MNKIFTQKKHAEVNLKESNDTIDSGENIFSPSQQSINNILNYSKALRVEKSKSMNYFEFVMN